MQDDLLQEVEQLKKQLQQEKEKNERLEREIECVYQSEKNIRRDLEKQCVILQGQVVTAERRIEEMEAKMSQFKDYNPIQINLCLCGCGKEAAISARGRRRKFYNDACKTRYWKRKQKKSSSKKTLRKVTIKKDNEN